MSGTSPEGGGTTSSTWQPRRSARGPSSASPKQTSLKSSFRTTGAERQRDQDVPGESWNDEDHYTNKSKDPRIGAHGRAYEPGERK